MQAIEGNRRGSLLYALNGYLYRRDSSKVQKSVGYRCTVKGCPARVLQMPDAMHVTVSHNHGEEGERIELLKLKTSLKRSAEESSGSLRQIFDCHTTTSSVGMAIGFAEVEASMYRRRRRVLPPLPSTAAEVYSAAEEAPERFWSSPKDGEKVMKGSVHSKDGGIGIVFAKSQMLDRLSNASDWYLDGTFKVVPHLFYQLLTIGYVENDTFWPSIYILLSRKTMAMYEAALQYVCKELCPGAAVCTVVTDFEFALMTAAENVLCCTVTGCWFHYCQSVVAKFKCSGLQSLINKRCVGALYAAGY
jgi:hypothetical protein